MSSGIMFVSDFCEFYFSLSPSELYVCTNILYILRKAEMKPFVNIGGEICSTPSLPKKWESDKCIFSGADDEI
jgi:hypothetical protein